MRSYYMRAKASDTGLVYNWHASSADFGGAGYPGTGVANDVFVESWYDDSSGGGVSASVDWKDSVRVATTGPLPASTRIGNVRTANANGALPSVDAVSLAAGEALLDKDHATGADRGVWEVTSLGSGGAPWVLTRRADCDSSSDVTGGLRVPVVVGTNGGKVFKLDTADPITLNTTALTFSQDSGAGASAGDGLQGTSVLSVKPDGSTITVGPSGVKVTDSSIDSTQLADNAVITSKIPDGAITPVKGQLGRATFDAQEVDGITVGNVALSGTPANLDTGVTWVDGVSRIGVPFNTNPAENGIYVKGAGGGAWVRAADAAASTDFRPGALVNIKGGAFGAGRTLRVLTKPATVGTDPIVYELSQIIVQPTAKGQNPTYDGSKYINRGLKTRAADLGDADVSVDVTEGSRFVIGTATSVSRALTLLVTGATDGRGIVVENAVPLAFPYNIKNAAGAIIRTLPVGGLWIASFQFTNDWQPGGWSENV